MVGWFLPGRDCDGFCLVTIALKPHSASCFSTFGRRVREEFLWRPREPRVHPGGQFASTAIVAADQAEEVRRAPWPCVDRSTRDRIPSGCRPGSSDVAESRR